MKELILKAANYYYRMIPSKRNAFIEGAEWYKKYGKAIEEGEWIEFNEDSVHDFNASDNCLCLFENGKVIFYDEAHPQSILTHFKKN